MSSKKVPARTRHAPALVGLGQQQSYCKFNDKSLIPKGKKRPQTRFSAALVDFVAFVDTHTRKRKQALRRAYNASLFNSVPFVCFKHSVFMHVIHYLFYIYKFLVFSSLLLIFFVCVFFSVSPTDFKNCSRVFWRRRGYQAPPPLLKNTPGVCRAPALTACPCRSIAACSGRRCQVLRVKWWTTGC